jgi:predicted O-methyltransferase YrrM
MTEPIDARQLAAWLDRLVPARAPVLAALEAEAAETGFPIIGPVCGNLCYLLTRLTGARRVCELGSGFGYSTAWFARGVKENGGGVVHHIVRDAGLSARARSCLSELDLGDVVHYSIGEAVATLRELAGPFDLIFNDIDKDGYPGALPVIEQKLRPGGLLVADNLIWHGRIFDDSDGSPATEGIRTFTRMVADNSAWTASILPVRDGILVARWDPTGRA